MSEALILALRKQIETMKTAQQQANQVVAKLMGSKLSDEQRDELFRLIVSHLDEQERVRSTQLVAVMRTATMQLNSIAQSLEPGMTKQELVSVIQALTLTTECSEHKVTKESDER